MKERGIWDRASFKLPYRGERLFKGFFKLWVDSSHVSLLFLCLPFEITYVMFNYIIFIILYDYIFFGLRL